MRNSHALMASIALAATCAAQVTQRVSVDSTGTQGAAESSLPGPSGSVVSADGRFVAFYSYSSNLVPGDTNSNWDIFVHDRQTGTTELASIDSNGGLSNGVSGVYGICISADGRFVLFESTANNLVPGDTNGSSDVFLRDRLTGTTERVSIGTGGIQGNGPSWYPSISDDGRFVAFTSLASNFVAGDTNSTFDVFVRDRVNRTTQRVSVSTSGIQGNDGSYIPWMAAGGRYVCFYSLASTLVAGDTNGTWDVFVHDLQSGSTERASVGTGGIQGNAQSVSGVLSADGRYLAFTSWASNLVPGDTNGGPDIFLRDRRLGVTTRISILSNGSQGPGGCGLPTITRDGRYVAFASDGPLAPGDTNGFIDIYVHDCWTGTTEYVSGSTTGVSGNNNSQNSSISADGRYVAFMSYADNLVPGDTNGAGDIFVHDRLASGFTSLCDPGLANVIACPCSNPPSASGRGCDNSSSTGGAALLGSGIAYLSTDSLVFTTSDERASATSLLLQGDAAIRTGTIFGQGIRCAGGTLKRLFSKLASGGSITAPDFSAGDPTISSRSQSLGDPILPGESRYYLVFYRDPIVLNGCPASSTFNATQTGQVTWWP